MALTNGHGFNPYTNKLYSSKYYSILEKRQTLPVWQHRENLLQLLEHNQTIILVGDTGSGKTTQIPQFLIEAGYATNTDQVACTQPRKMAAISVSRRVADEMDVTIGDEVGYSVRFDECSGPKTRLKYLTDGMLLREAMTDSLLKRYQVIILDEAHERTEATDVLLALLKVKILKQRPNLKLVVMSATLEVESFQGYFNGAPLMKVPGRLHPVEILYTKTVVANYFNYAIDTVVYIHAYQKPGDILLFLTGEDEIEDACKQINTKFQNLKDLEVGPVNVIPLYAALPFNMQLKVFDKVLGRKIVVSTNIAETSLTIEGIVYVVDPGFVKQNIYNPQIHGESLPITPISKASADQRAGRAGRTQPGMCFRLYTERDYNNMQAQICPEIQRSNLAKAVLTLKKLGVDNLVHFDYIDPPAPQTLSAALELLVKLGAMDEDANLTKIGEIMGEFPLDPQMSKMLVASPKFQCSNEILTIVAMLSAPNCFLRPKNAQKVADEAKSQFSHIDGDHLTLLNVFHAWKQNGEDATWCYANFLDIRALQLANNIRTQLVYIMKRYDLKMCSPSFNNGEYYVNIRKALLVGYFMQVAHLEGTGQYRTAKNNETAQLHPSSSLYSTYCKPEWVIYDKLLLRRQNFIQNLTVVRREWLVDSTPY